MKLLKQAPSSWLFKIHEKLDQWNEILSNIFIVEIGAPLDCLEIQQEARNLESQGSCHLFACLSAI